MATSVLNDGKWVAGDFHSFIKLMLKFVLLSLGISE